MPRRNGYEATAEIRQLGQTVPIIAVTANAMQSERERCLSAGMDDFLAKPFKREDLVPLLQKWLGPAEVIEEEEDADAASDASVDGGPAVTPASLPPESEAGEDDRCVFDYDEAVRTFMGQTAVVVRLLESFQEKIRAQFATIEEALARGDMETVRVEAHAIKGGSWNLHAERLGDKAFELEEAGREGDARRSGPLLAELRQRFEEFAAYVSAHVGA
jgi:HPt (histidine-containing phosphotransfer) domain-containing protein